MVHTSLYSFIFAAIAFAPALKVRVCMGFPSLLNRLCELRYSAGFGTGLGGGGHVYSITVCKKYELSPAVFPLGQFCVSYL
jgi:hypothetical protein